MVKQDTSPETKESDIKMGKQDTSPDTPAHTPGTAKGEEKVMNEGKEPGRHDTSTEGADRPAGTSTARSSTSVNAEDMEPIDPKMPNMPPA